MGRHEATDESVIQLVDRIIQEAIVQRASDIHIEPRLDSVRIRFRIDGLLYDRSALDARYINTFISRIKILANINIAEKRIPQDGRFSFAHDATSIDVRVSTFPSVHGQKVVLRLLDRSAQVIALDQLGFNQLILDRFQQLLRTSSGFFLVTGPTGSGKTTTLYAALQALNSPEKNIITLEDPVEYHIDGITQGHIHPDAGFTFEKGIRALLRQDPNIVMIGEIRDKQTAQIAIEAALTGHVVLSTLHTNDAPSALIRLMDMGVEPFLLNAAITGILAQRLGRRICSSCRQQVPITDDECKEAERLKISLKHSFKGQGCKECFGIGMKGRIGIFELLEPSHDLKHLVSQQASAHHLVAQAAREGMITMLNDGMRKIEEGLISFGELIRAVC